MLSETDRQGSDLPFEVHPSLRTFRTSDNLGVVDLVVNFESSTSFLIRGVCLLTYFRAHVVPRPLLWDLWEFKFSESVWVRLFPINPIGDQDFSLCGTLVRY